MRTEPDSSKLFIGEISCKQSNLNLCFPVYSLVWTFLFVIIQTLNFFLNISPSLKPMRSVLQKPFIEIFTCCVCVSFICGIFVPFYTLFCYFNSHFSHFASPYIFLFILLVSTWIILVLFVSVCSLSCTCFCLLWTLSHVIHTLYVITSYASYRTCFLIIIIILSFYEFFYFLTHHMCLHAVSF